MKTLAYGFDEAVTKKIQSWPAGVWPVMHLVTIVGRPMFTVPIGLAVLGYGWLVGEAVLYDSGGIILVTQAVGLALKYILRRPRPATEYVARMRFQTFSLPSGHAVGSVVSYGTLALLLAVHVGGLIGITVSLLAIPFLLLIGVSRVYLGAHFPSDVIAGWSIGALGLAAIIIRIGVL